MNDPNIPPSFLDKAVIEITAAMASNFMPGSEYDKSQINDLVTMAYQIADALNSKRSKRSISRYRTVK